MIDAVTNMVVETVAVGETPNDVKSDLKKDMIPTFSQTLNELREFILETYAIAIQP